MIMLFFLAADLSQYDKWSLIFIIIMCPDVSLTETVILWCFILIIFNCLQRDKKRKKKHFIYSSSDFNNIHLYLLNDECSGMKE